jgi:glycosyltransferase involved in cell wall biosynthesis
MVKLSICCITFNHAEYIRNCIESILIQQTNFDFELLIYDDASTDNNQEIIKKAACNDKRIKLFLQEENQWSKGKFGLLTDLFPAASGKYIAFCEGDDMWNDPYKLQKQVDFLEANPDYVISFHEVEKVDSAGKSLNQTVLGINRHKDLDREDLLSGNLIPTVSAVIRSDLVRGLPEIPKGFTNGDTFLFAILGQYGKAHFHKDILPAKYRIHEGGVWSGIDAIRKIESQIFTFETLYKVVARDKKEIVKTSLFEKYFNQISRFDYSASEKVIMYMKLWRFCLENRLLKKMIDKHILTLKTKVQSWFQ